MEALRIQLKSLAMQRAKQNALALTSPLNQKLGSALHISDVSNYGTVSRMLGEVVVRGYATSKVNPEPIDIEFEKIKVNAAVNVKFKLE